MKTQALLFAAPAFLLSACQSYGGGKPSALADLKPVDDAQRNAVIVGKTSDYERDRAAILAMLGEYGVSFSFDETVALKPGYVKRDDKTTGAREVVLLVEDAGKTIVLQHLLVSEMGGMVIKHWRQDWHYEASERLEFVEDQTWRLKPIAAEKIAGHWTQCVYEVSDAPRYCGTGKWTHKYGSPTWTSDRSWRPLPRREYTKRSDYNALNAENRHTITPSGWTHEQDNTKTIREGEKTASTLVREFGFNDYRRIDGFDFKPAYDYWAKTKDYWASVRQQWASRIQSNRGIALKTEVDGMRLITPLFKQADRARAGAPVPSDEIAELFEQLTGAPEPRRAMETAHQTEPQR